MGLLRPLKSSFNSKIKAIKLISQKHATASPYNKFDLFHWIQIKWKLFTDCSVWLSYLSKSNLIKMPLNQK